MRYLLCLLILFLPSQVFAWEQQEHAIKSGAAFEERVSELFRENGFEVERHAGYGGDDENEITLKNTGRRIVLQQPPYTTLYGGPGRYDFLVMAPELEYPVWIETKYQKTSGSIDEKVPYVFLNALQAVPGRHVIILVGGDGWRDGAWDWIYAAQHNREFLSMSNYPDKRVEVMKPDEFTAWLKSLRQ